VNESIFEKVKEIARIEEVVEHFGVHLDRYGKALCPFHNEKTPSFSIKSEDNIFKCFGCGEGGDAIDFVAKYKGVEPVEAAKMIAEMYGIDDNQRGEKQQARQVISKATKPQKTASVAAKQGIKEYIKACIKDVGKTDYFIKRGLSKETITKFGLGYDIKKQCAVIPYSSEHTYYQTRSIDGKEFRKPPTEIAGTEPLWNAKALSGTGAVFIVESPICAMSIMQYCEAAIATCGTSGVNKIAAAIKVRKPRCTFVLSMDNDEPGQEAQQDLANHLFESSVKFIPCNIAGECKDPNELLIKDAKQLEQNIKTATLQARKQYATEKDSFAACELVNETIEPVEWIVENLLPTGLAMLCAPSKYGKSWMVLQLCIAAAEGNSFLNFKTVQCGSLYYALEDGKARLQDRLKKILKGKNAPKGIRFAIKADTLETGLLNKIEDELKAFPDIKLVIIDTLQKVRGKMSKDDTLYGNEYRQMAAVKEFADKHKICLLFVHHLRKMADEADVFNMISGSTALMGATDTILIISKKKRNDDQATFSSTGRDIEQSELVVAFDKSKYKGEVEGTVEEIAARRELEEYESNIYVQTIKELVKRNPISGWSGSAQDLMKAVYDITGKQVVESTQAVGRQISRYDYRLHCDDIEHKVSRTGSARKHSFKKIIRYAPVYQGTIYDD
jgi:DNA primase